MNKSSLLDPSQWNGLDHLRNCCAQKEKGFKIANDKVKFEGVESEFPFEEQTSFQATSSGTKKAPFYFLGTLAFFMKCRGLKHSAYVKRTEALKHKQYVKKIDHAKVLDFLTDSESKVPRNAKNVSSAEEAEAGDFFADKSDATDESYVIHSDEVFADKLELVFAQNDDIYVGGVSIGKCDLRLLLKLGDKVRCQVYKMSRAESRKLKKSVGLVTDYMAPLVYFGSEKRPKSGTLTPILSR